MAAAEVLIAETKQKLHLAATKRTNRDSLVEDVWAKNPKIKEEVSGWVGGWVGGNEAVRKRYCMSWGGGWLRR